MRKLLPLCLCLMLSGVLIGCQEDKSSLPQPIALTDDAVGLYCGMILTEHSGPKAQVFEKYNPAPLWFSSVKDAVIYLALQGEAQDAIVTYVHDMARADSWEKPQGDGIWINIRDAYLVIGSQKLGGMRMTEFVPFSLKNKAEEFTREYGGRVARLSQITSEDIELAQMPPSSLLHEKGLE